MLDRIGSRSGFLDLDDIMVFVYGLVPYAQLIDFIIVSGFG
jgi:hypothetical protein